MGIFNQLNEFNAKKQRDDAASKQAVEAKLNANQPSPMPGVAKASTPMATPQPVARANAETGTAPAASSVMGQGAYRTEALGDMNETEFAKNQAQMNATGKEYWDEQVKKNPTSTYAALQQFFADNETPAEKAKRERRERLGEVFNNLGNLIGNAANLYYTSKGGQYIDLNTANEKHQARMDAIKAKQDALKQRQDELLMNAKLGEIQAARKEKANKEQRDYDEKIRKENRAYQERKDKQSQDNWNKQFEQSVKQEEQAAAERADEKEYRRKQDELNNNFRWAQLNWQKEKAKGSGSSSSGGGKNTKMAVVDTPKGVMDVDFGKINQTTYNQLYAKVNDEIKKKYEIGALDDEKVIQDKMGKAISDALMSQEGYADWLESAGVGSYQVQAKPKDYSQYEEDEYNSFMRGSGYKTIPTQASPSLPQSGSDVAAILENNKKKKGEMLQAGKDSLLKGSGYGMKSDTFR